MSENSVYNYSDTCSSLEEMVKDLEVRIRISEQNTKLRNNYSERLGSLERAVVLCNNALGELKEISADVKEYIAKKKKASIQNINNALRLAGEIIPDSTDGIYFHIEDDGSAWLSTPDGLDVDDVEGGGYRQVSSNFVRAVILGANPNLLQTLILDEMFSMVSVANSAALSLYLNVLAQNVQILSIEQKPQVYSNVDYTKYTLVAGEYANVTKEVFKYNSVEEVDDSAG